jgi:hypothetical protein
MPATDEDILRDLMRRCTNDVYPPASITTRVVTRQRRRQRRTRAVSIAATGAVLGTAAGVVATSAGGVGSAARPGHGAPSGPRTAITLTAAQRTLYRLSSAAAAAPEGSGRYVVLSEKQDNYLKSSVIDSVTGDIWTYQQGAGVPSQLPVDPHGSSTQAQFEAMPTDPAALRAVLVAQFDAQQKQAEAALAGLGRKAHVPAQPQESSDDKVFEQATGMLWNPLVGPALRSALFRVLATTPGVTVNAQARDNLGRPAVEISRFDSVSQTTYATFEDPATTAVLEQTYTNPPDTGDGATGFAGTDLYLSITWTAAVPADPYGG